MFFNNVFIKESINISIILKLYHSISGWRILHKLFFILISILFNEVTND